MSGYLMKSVILAFNILENNDNKHKAQNHKIFAGELWVGATSAFFQQELSEKHPGCKHRYN